MLVAALAIGAHLATPYAALACSGEIDPLRDNDLIFMGRVTGMSLADGEAGFGTPETVAVWVDFAVDRYLKGDGPPHLSALDTSSVAFLDDQTREQREAFEGAQYWGGGGACGTLDEDPRGQYWLTGATVGEDGTVRLHRIHLYSVGGIGSGPDDPVILERLAEIEALLAQDGVAPANVGYAPLGTGRDRRSEVVAIIATSALLLAGWRATARSR